PSEEVLRVLENEKLPPTYHELSLMSKKEWLQQEQTGVLSVKVGKGHAAEKTLVNRRRRNRNRGSNQPDSADIIPKGVRTRLTRTDDLETPEQEAPHQLDIPIALRKEGNSSLSGVSEVQESTILEESLRQTTEPKNGLEPPLPDYLEGITTEAGHEREDMQTNGAYGALSDGMNIDIDQEISNDPSGDKARGNPQDAAAVASPEEITMSDFEAPPPQESAYDRPAPVIRTALRKAGGFRVQKPQHPQLTLAGTKTVSLELATSKAEIYVPNRKRSSSEIKHTLFLDFLSEKNGTD
ncbi:hypothetical protein LTR93_012323, partial [Exophiala xenobiotica]